MNPLSNRFVWMYQKNRHLIDALVLGNAPEFIAHRRPPRDLAHIPVFTFHVAIPERFEQQCAHLAENKYHALSAEEFRKIMFGELPPKKNSVLITFDDGLKQVWTVAYPILKKYDLKATVFLVPGCIRETTDAVRPTMNDVWAGTAGEREVFGVVGDESALATWPEVIAMHESGVLDFQSHTMWHSLVHSSGNIVDFGRPDYDCHYFGNVHVPLYQRNGADLTERTMMLGMPIYEAAPRMQTESRYFDDEGLRNHCVEFVQREGGADFFQRGDWRSLLQKQVDDYKRKFGSRDRFESPEERDASIKEDLVQAKQEIESRLQGKNVNQLCFPWYRGRKFAQTCAVETGHNVTYYDREADILENIAGSGKGRIARVDETWVRRLPGVGRMSKLDVIKETIGLRDLKSRMFPAAL